MTDTKTPQLNKKQLLKALLWAAVIGTVVLFTAVLPAEYNIDPLGTGKLFGFSRLYVAETPIDSVPPKTVNGVLNFKTLKLEKLGSSSDVPKPIEANDSTPKTQYSMRYDTITVNVPMGRGIEYKFNTLKLGTVKYEWATDTKEVVYIDFHGEVYQENPPDTVFYESYILAYSNNMAGTFTAPFKGRHGWYFRNETKNDIVVTIRLKGAYELPKDH